MTKDEAMRLALEALEFNQARWQGKDEAIAAIEAVLAQPSDSVEPTPEQLAALGWQSIECPFCGTSGAQAFPKPEQEPQLTPSGIHKIGCVNHDCQHCKEMKDWEGIAADQAMTIALMKSEQQEQEPLEYWNAVEGWVKIDEVRKHFETVSCGTIYKNAGEGRVPLYTAPPKREPDDFDSWYASPYAKVLMKSIEEDYQPKREWVGLTGQEKALIASVSLDVHDAIYRANDKLKELNHG